MLSPVSTGWVTVFGWVYHLGVKPRSAQPCILPGSLNRVPALIGWGKGGNVTSATWQVTLWSHMVCVFPWRWGIFANCYTPFTLLLLSSPIRSYNVSRSQPSVMMQLLPAFWRICADLYDDMHDLRNATSQEVLENSFTVPRNSSPCLFA